MELKKGYKRTEVGVIPEDWESLPAGDVIQFFGGNGFSSNAETASGIKWLKIANVGIDHVQWDSISFLPDSFFFIYKDYILKENDVVMALTRPILNNQLKLAKISRRDEPALLNQRVAKLIPKFNNCMNFLIYVLKQSYFVTAMNIAMAGTDPPNISNKTLEKILIVLPPTKTEQTAIANALSDADAWIQSLTRLIDKKRQIKQGAMQDLLDPYENGILKSGWELTSYGRVFDFLVTASYSRSELNKLPEGCGYIHYGDIHTLWDEFLDFKNHEVPTIPSEKAKGYALLKNGDVIIADASEDYDGIGKSVEIKSLGNKEVICGLHTFLLRDRTQVFVDGFKGYIHLSRFVKKQFHRLASGLKVYGISKANLKVIQIPLPPKKEQTAIAKILSDMDAEIQTLGTKLAKAKQIKQGMMQELLTGRIRLVKPPEAEETP